MRVLVTGAAGQVGSEVVRQLAALAQVVARDRASLDLADADAIVATVRDVRPDVIVNAAAYTAVDKAESEPQAAHAINARAPGVLAEEARRCGALLVHYSTDYVFAGNKPGAYAEDDPVDPVNEYGRSKLQGEEAVRAAGGHFLILRTEWVYGPHGKNFMLTMLRLARSRAELRVVDDQRGAPTSSIQLGRLTRELLAAPGRLDRGSVDRVRERSGLYHATAAGETTWCGFARAIFEARAARDPHFRPPRVIPIPSSEYPTPARRPSNSVLSNEKLGRAFETRIAPWQDGLGEALDALPIEG